MEMILEASRFVNHPSGFLACSPANRQFRQAGLEGFVSYRVQGRHWIALGGVHAPGEQAAALLNAFLEAAKADRRRALFVQVPQHQVPLFEGAGAIVNRLGSTFALRLAGYTLKGTAKIPLRNKIHKAQRANLHVVEAGGDQPMDGALRQQIARVSQAWLRDKGKKELAFMIGAASDAHDGYRRTFAAVDATGNVVAFITYVPVWGTLPGYLHDLSRRAPDAPTGAMELINSFAIARMQAEGAAYLHFGFTPFVMTGDEPPSASRLMSRISTFLYRHGSFVYPAGSQASYKRKWGADVVMPEYIAGFPLSLGAIVALLRLTRAL